MAVFDIQIAIFRTVSRCSHHRVFLHIANSCHQSSVKNEQNLKYLDVIAVLRLILIYSHTHGEKTIKLPQSKGKNKTKKTTKTTPD